MCCVDAEHAEYEKKKFNKLLEEISENGLAVYSTPSKYAKHRLKLLKNC